jgi:crossover junction endodeoxyribonuclease RuvC
MTEHMFVLGIDPGLSVTGYGVVESTAAGERAVAIGTIRTDAGAPVAERLLELHRDIAA